MHSLGTGVLLSWKDNAQTAVELFSCSECIQILIWRPTNQGCRKVFRSGLHFTAVNLNFLLIVCVSYSHHATSTLFFLHFPLLRFHPASVAHLPSLPPTVHPPPFSSATNISTRFIILFHQTSSFKHTVLFFLLITQFVSGTAAVANFTLLLLSSSFLSCRPLLIFLVLLLFT